MRSSVSEHKPEEYLQQLKTHYADIGAVLERDCDMVRMTVPVEHWTNTARSLRDAREFAFSQLTDLCGVDFLAYGQREWDTETVSGSGFSRGIDGAAVGRFGASDTPRETTVENRFVVMVHLLSVRHNRRLRLCCFATDDGMPKMPSLVDVWNNADWYEREAFDLYGIVFEGHPDLRRLLTDYGFVGHPLRKDFPLSGNVELRYDSTQRRIVYQPVSIQPRVLVPRVIRDDSRYADRDVEPSSEG